MDKPDNIEGGCLCGATRYRATGVPYKVLYCHCNWCRKATGAPVSVWLMFDQGQVAFIVGSPQKYASSPGVLRGFCPTCGTPLWWEGAWDDKPVQMVPSGSLDDPTQRDGPHQLDSKPDLISEIFCPRILVREGAEDDPKKTT